MRFRDDESGQMLVLTALCMTMLMGFLALAIDVGILFRAKRNVQIAADAGAIAGALQEQYRGTPNPTCGGGVTGVRCAAQNAVAANGVPAADVASVNTNPTNGYHTGAGYVETIVSVPNPTFFMSAFRGVRTSLSVTARAVAGMAPSTTCMYVLDPTDQDALNVAGPVTAPGCGIQVNSSSQNASCDQGETLAVPFLHVSGGQDGGGGCTPTNSTQVVTGVAPSGDPLNNLLGVNATSVCTPLNTLTLGVGNLINAATRIPSSLLNLGGLSVTVSCFGDLNVLLSALTLGRPGTNQLFVFLNGVQLSGNVTINGTVDVAQGILQQGTAQLAINAPNDPANPLNGIAMIQPSTNTTPCSPTVRTPCLQLRLVGGSVNGLIYAPTAKVVIQGAGGVGGIIAYQLDIDGPLSLTRNYNLANPTTSPLNKVELVE
jgi:Flp pilus assembly protein TadG